MYENEAQARRGDMKNEVRVRDVEQKANKDEITEVFTT